MWIVGLAVQPSGLALDGWGRELASRDANQSVAVAIQPILVQGIAALALGVVVTGLIVPSDPTCGDALTIRYAPRRDSLVLLWGTRTRVDRLHYHRQVINALMSTSPARQ